MRAWYLAVFCAAAATVAIASAQGIGRDGIYRFDYPGGPYTITCPVNEACDIALGKDEEIPPDRLPVPGDTDDWDIGVSRGMGVHVIVTPLKAFTTTSMVVLTSNRAYHFFLRSVAGNTTHAVVAYGFDYHEPTPPPVVYLPPPPTPTPDPDPLASMDLRTLNCDPSLFRVTGRASFHPYRICVDDVRTYIEIGKVAEVPALLGLDPHGVTRRINYGFRDGFYVVPALYRAFQLVLGSGRDTEIITIEHN